MFRAFLVTDGRALEPQCRDDRGAAASKEINHEATGWRQRFDEVGRFSLGLLPFVMILFALAGYNIFNERMLVRSRALDEPQHGLEPRHHAELCQSRIWTGVQAAKRLPEPQMFLDRKRGLHHLHVTAIADQAAAGF